MELVFEFPVGVYKADFLAFRGFVVGIEICEFEEVFVGG